MFNINITTFLLVIFAYQYSAKESISRQKCEEYGKQFNTCKFSKDQRVEYGQFPHIVSLGYEVDGKIQYKCSGVLISDQYVVTTAYCGSTRIVGPAVRAKLGVLQLENVSNETHYQEIKIKEVIFHPNYKPIQKYNDISLLKLEAPITINEYVRPACLPDLSEKQTKYLLTGWEIFNNTESQMYLTVYENIFEISTLACNNFFKHTLRHLKNGIDAETHFCAGPPEIVCTMLGGAPLQTLDKQVNCMFDIHAISSFGRSCSSPAPTIFTKIAPYVEWIESIVWS